MNVLQQYDISQYEFAEICDKYAFYFHESSKGGSNYSEYCKIWEEIEAIKPSMCFKYEHETPLGDIVKIWEDGISSVSEGWTIRSYKTPNIKI